MDEFSFEFGDILSPEEATQLFEQTVPDKEEVSEEEIEQETDETEIDDNHPAEEDDVNQPSEKVGEEDTKQKEDATDNRGGGSSPSVYSSIAKAFKVDGIFPDFEDNEIDAVQTPEAFAELMEKAITARVDERVKRADAALQNGVQPDQVRAFEETLGYLGSIDEDRLKAEGEEGEELRKQLIYNDLINRGFSKDKALRELDKSFKTGNDIEDAKDALDALIQHYQNQYQQIQDESRARIEEGKKKQKQMSDDFKRMILDSEVKIGETKLDKKTCQKIYDSVSRPVYKDPDTGKLLTLVQKFQKEQPLEFLKQLGMWYVLTDGGKNTAGFTKQQLREERNKGIKELGRKINSTSLNPDGTLRYDSATTENGDLLLSDEWSIG